MDGRDSRQICRIVVGVSDKQSWTVERELGNVLTDLHCKKPACYSYSGLCPWQAQVDPCLGSMKGGQFLVTLHVPNLWKQPKQCTDYFCQWTNAANM